MTRQAGRERIQILSHALPPTLLLTTSHSPALLLSILFLVLIYLFFFSFFHWLVSDFFLPLSDGRGGRGVGGEYVGGSFLNLWVRVRVRLWDGTNLNLKRIWIWFLKFGCVHFHIHHFHIHSTSADVEMSKRSPLYVIFESKKLSTSYLGCVFIFYPSMMWKVFFTW